jgi:autophagy-related protein 9
LSSGSAIATPRWRLSVGGCCSFISFIAGSFAAVLLLLTILDPAALLSLEITPHRTVLFYLTLFGAVLAVTRTGGEGGSEGRKAYDPEVLMRGVEYFTHWMPADWEGRLHSTYVCPSSPENRSPSSVDWCSTFTSLLQVLDAFSRLFTLKVVVFLSEIASVFLTPLLLWKTLPAQAEPIVDFFREFTIQVEGVGHVCSFAVFDFGRVGSGKGRGEETAVPNGRWPSGHAAKLDRTREREPAGGKMERSFLNFRVCSPPAPCPRLTSRLRARLMTRRAAP